MRRPPARVRALTAVAVGLAGLSFPGPAAAQEPGRATLLSSAESVTAGQTLGLTGLVEAPEECSAGRGIELQRFPPGASWELLEAGTTGPDGAFSFSVAPEHTAVYRALAPATEECAEVVSPEALVTVAPLVESLLAATVLGAGNCVDLSATISPDKTGQVVRIQRERPWGWQTIDTATLGEGSAVVASLCFGWDDIGTMRLRARWPAQDPLNVAASGPVLSLEVVKAAWMRRIDRLTAGRSVSVSVREAGEFLYRRRDRDPRIPASNQKLLLSMAILDSLGPGFRFETRVVGPSLSKGVIRGDLWILGRGDPGIGRPQLRRLARKLADAGVRRIRGSVMGSTTYFARDWWAPGWRWYFPTYHVPLPTALTFRGNRSKSGRHVRDPERRAATYLTSRLKARGIRVAGDPGAGRAPRGLDQLAAIRSPRLGDIVRRMNVWSSNFHAEVLGKRLGVAASGTPGTIASGAGATARWAADHRVSVTSYDGSGLSYGNRVTAAGLARLLGTAEGLPWGGALRSSLPGGGWGTLGNRLGGVPVRAKTGTLVGVSALSGYVWLDRRATWAEFSILVSGTSKSTAVRIEDAVVRILAERAR
ncbi:MAG: D-alanyl-D-alanine carboxypeptidase/D-alanyl-D-alanine-endopeptidase [Actinomycetota bacterium]